MPGRSHIITAHEQRLTADHYKILGLSSLGGALEYYEFVVFILLTPYISQNFFPAVVPEWIRTLQTLAIFAAGYLVRPLGGIALGMMGDLLGRKRIFALTIFLMAVPTLVIGILPSYRAIGISAPIALLGCRIFQGLALGGEIPGAVVFVFEHVPRNRLGLACSLIGAGLSLGLLIGAMLIGFLVRRYGQPTMMDFGWRAPFVIGGVFGLVAAYLRRYVQETPVFLEIQKHKEFGKKTPLKSIFQSSGKPLIYSLMVSITTAAIVPAIYLFPPVYFRTALGLDPHLVQRAHTSAIIAMIIGSVVGGWLVDRVGGIKVFIVYTIGAVAAVFWMFAALPAASQKLQMMYAVVGFLCSITSFGYYFLAQAFPPRARFTGISLAYNVSSAVLGGLTPLILQVLTRVEPLAVAYYVAMIGIIGIVGAVLLWPRRYEIDESRRVDRSGKPELEHSELTTSSGL